MEPTGGNNNQTSSLTDDEKKHVTPTMHPSSRRSLPSPSPPFLNKFATIATDKYTQNLRRDLLLSNFDRNLTVEQAHFDPNLSLHVPQDNSPTTGNSSSSGPLANHSISSNNNDNSNSNTDFSHHHGTNNYSNTYPPSSDSISIGAHSPPLGPMLTPPTEPPYLSRRTSNSKLDAKRKQAKRSPMHSTATPSEYFHRNLVDAVSNVEDSDENEYYVYPYSGNEHHNSNNNSPDYYSPAAPRSPLGSKKSHTGTLRPSLSSHELKDASTATTKPRRPKLRSYVMDPHSTKKEYGSMMGSQARFSDGQLLRSSKRNPPSKRYLPTYQQVTDGYASDDEGESLVWKNDRRKRNRHRWLPLWVICGSIALFFLLCFMGLLYGGAQPLQEVTISMGRVLASDKELIFDLRVTAYNPNGWTVHVADAEMSVFAFSRIVPLYLSEVNGTSSNLTLGSSSYTGADPAEYLGSFYHFDEPLAFSSSIFSYKRSHAVSQIRIKSPGDDEGGNERWSRMIRYPYGLLARGILSYHSLGLPGVHPQSATICNVAKVDPITGVVSGDPDQGYCSTSNK